MKDKILYARQRKLLYMLNSAHGIVTGREISRKLVISERTVRSDIAQINKKLETYQVRIEAVSGKGYCLRIGDRTLFHELFSERDNIQTREDRGRYLLMKLLRTEGWCDLRDLEEEVFVSRTTLENDLREIKGRLEASQLHIVMERKGNLLRLEEDEGKKRRILVHLYYENWDYDSRDGILLREDYLSRELLNQSRILLKQVLKRYRIQLDDFGMIYMVLSVAVAYARVLENQRLRPVGFRSEVAVVNQAAEQLLREMRQLFELDFEAEESCWLADILDKLIILNLELPDRAELSRTASPEQVALTERLLGEVKVRYGFDLSADDQFYAALLRQIQAFANGMISVHLHNEYVVESLRTEEPFLTDIACYISRRIGELCGVKMGRTEENYVLPLLIAAQHRITAAHFKGGIKAVVVSHLNTGLTGYLLQQLEHLYGSRLALSGPLPIYDREKIEQLHPDCIITTVQMDVFRQFSIPVVIVSPLLAKTERERIDQCIETVEKAYLYGCKTRLVK